jgi:hypothetical protein
MKALGVFPLVLLALALPANAGNMFGPPPFRNGSPLVSGVDGAYQATARAENVTGIFRFAYSGGSQTANPRQNSWIFFVGGQVFRGNVQANINESSIDGILDSEISSATTNNDGSVTLPYVYINRDENAAGTFSGKLQLKSPSGAFDGQGVFQGLPGSTNQIIGISLTTEESPVIISGIPNVVPAGAIYVTNAAITNQASQLSPTRFRFRGVRTSTSTQSSEDPTAAQ